MWITDGYLDSTKKDKGMKNLETAKQAEKQQNVWLKKLINKEIKALHWQTRILQLMTDLSSVRCFSTWEKSNYETTCCIVTDMQKNTCRMLI